MNIKLDHSNQVSYVFNQQHFGEQFGEQYRNSCVAVTERLTLTQDLTRLPALKHNKISTQSLTEREMDIVDCLLKGKTAKETGKQLFISSRTVERHLENIKGKLQCRSKFELVNKILSMKAKELSVAI